MNKIDNFHVALANLRANKARSILSMLGIVIGTGAVIVVISIVNGTRVASMKSMAAGTEDMLFLRPRFSEQMGTMGKLSMEDVERLRIVEHVVSAIPELSWEEEARGTRGKATAMMVGVDSIALTKGDYKLLSGRLLTAEDVDRRRRIAVISEKLSTKLFSNDYPIGQRIRMQEMSVEVAGVVTVPEYLTRIGQAPDILLPIETLMRIMKNVQIYSIAIRTEPGKVDKAKENIGALLASNPRQMGLFEVEDPRTYLKELAEWSRTWMMQMILISGISLLVGGIGLMNVMLTTVAERTHEIGLRKALGADDGAVLHQFLVESATLSGIGGASGVLLGVIIALGLSVLSKGQIMVEIPPLALLLSFLFSVAIGLIFGLFPASKAAHLSPVEALRYE
jgi:putative ABC transport system permease protein